MKIVTQKIIAFKSDRVGDLILFSPFLKTVKENMPNSEITLVCSSYNYQVAKNYNFVDKYIVLDNKNILKDLFINFKVFFLTRYKHLFQFDGKNNSFRISYFINSNTKSTICYVKNKKILNFKVNKMRPSKIILKLLFDNYQFRDENYELKPRKTFQNLYFEILNQLKFKITSKKNVFSLEKKYDFIYQSFFDMEILIDNISGLSIIKFTSFKYSLVLLSKERIIF